MTRLLTKSQHFLNAAILLFVTLLPALFSILQKLVRHITPLLASLHWFKLRNVLNTNFFSLHKKISTTSQATYLHNLVSLKKSLKGPAGIALPSWGDVY